MAESPVDQLPVGRILAIAGSVLLFAFLISQCGGDGGGARGEGLDARTEETYQALRSSQSKPFKGTYRATTKDGKLSGTLVTYQQNPPKFIYRTRDYVYLYDGDNVVTCTSGLDPTTPLEQGCRLIPGGTPGQGTVEGNVLFTPSVVLDEFQTVAAGSNLRTDHETRVLAGLTAQCTRLNGFSRGGQRRIELCVIPEGFVGSWDDGNGNTFALTASSPTPDPRDFEPPAPPLTEQQLREKQQLFQATSTTTVPGDSTATTSDEDSTDTTRRRRTTTTEGGSSTTRTTRATTSTRSTTDSP